MKEAQNASKFGRFGDGVSAAVVAVASIETKADARMRGYVKEALAFFRRLDVGGHVGMKDQVEAEFGRDFRGLFDNVRDILPLRRREARTAIFGDASGNAVAFIGLRIRQHQEWRLQSRQQIADLANVLDRDSSRCGSLRTTGTNDPSSLSFRWSSCGLSTAGSVGKNP